MEPTGPPLLGALMRMPVDAIYRRLLSRLHEQGYTEVVAAHFAILRWPGPAGRRPSEIADEAGMSKQAVNYLLGQLSQHGYLERTDDPGDRRSRRIELTARGKALGKAIRTEVGRIERELDAELGARDYAELRRLLERLNETSVVGGADT
jgi:DNA-binding MarR family transcriptional regulator